MIAFDLPDPFDLVRAADWVLDAPRKIVTTVASTTMFVADTVWDIGRGIVTMAGSGALDVARFTVEHPTTAIGGGVVLLLLLALVFRRTANTAITVTADKVRLVAEGDYRKAIAPSEVKNPHKFRTALYTTTRAKAAVATRGATRAATKASTAPREGHGSTGYLVDRFPPVGPVVSLTICAPDLHQAQRQAEMARPGVVWEVRPFGRCPESINAHWRAVNQGSKK